MTSWICAECGRERSPSGRPETSAVLHEIESLVQPPAPEPEILQVIGLDAPRPAPVAKNLAPLRPAASISVVESLGLQRSSVHGVVPKEPEIAARREPSVAIEIYPAVVSHSKPSLQSRVPALTIPTFLHEGSKSRHSKRAIRIVVAAVVLWAIASSVHRFITSPAASVSANAGRTAPKVNAALTSHVPELDSETEYPFARFVEVTELRIVDRNGRSQAQYLVVNHSSSQLADIGLRIAVRSAAMAGGASPLFTLAARVPTLAAHESKEIRTDLDSNLSPSQLPDLVNLRTDVKIISPQ